MPESEKANDDEELICGYPKSFWREMGLSDLAIGRLPRTPIENNIFDIASSLVPIFSALAWLLLISGFILMSLRSWIPNLIASNHQTVVYYIVAAFVLVISFAGYRFRCRARRLYGSMEVIFGIGSSLLAGWALLTIEHFKSENAWNVLAPLLAGVYICIRGLSNIEEAIWHKPAPVPSTVLQKIWSSTFYDGIVMKLTKEEIAIIEKYAKKQE